MLTGYTVLMLTDDSQTYRNLEWVLEHKGCRVLRVDADAAWSVAIHLRRLDLILVRINREGGEEMEFLKKIKRLRPQVRVILCSREGETAFPVEAYRLEVDDYLLMPCPLAELRRRVEAVFHRLPGRCSSLAVRSGWIPLHQAVLEKFQRVFLYIRYNLNSSTAALQPLINPPAPALDQKLLSKIHEVSARLEVLQEMTEGFIRGISGMDAAARAMDAKQPGPLHLGHG